MLKKTRQLYGKGGLCTHTSAPLTYPAAAGDQVPRFTANVKRGFAPPLSLGLNQSGGAEPIPPEGAEEWNFGIPVPAQNPKYLLRQSLSGPHSQGEDELVTGVPTGRYSFSLLLFVSTKEFFETSAGP